MPPCQQVHASTHLSFVGLSNDAPEDRAPVVVKRCRAAEASTFERLLVDSLPVVDRVVASLARKYGLSSPDEEDLAGQVRLKLVEADYAVLRKFRGDCSLRSYLTVVVERLVLDRRISLRGKWRPAAAARRAGDIAVSLDRLTSCDGLSFDQACSVLASTHQQGVEPTALASVYEQLPVRSRRTWVGEEALRDVSADSGNPGEALGLLINKGTASRASRTLSRELARMSDDDRQLIEWCFGEGRSVADIARATSVEQKALYRAVRGVLLRLRRALETSGVTRRDVVALLGRTDVELPTVLSRRRGDNGRRSAPAARP